MGEEQEAVKVREMSDAEAEVTKGSLEIPETGWENQFGERPRMHRLIKN